MLNKKVIPGLFCLLILLIVPTAWAENFADMPDNWSTQALQNAVEKGYLSGYAGYLYPDKNLTRAEAASILNRILDNQAEADLSAYTDLDKNQWYYPDLAKAVQAGILLGDDSSLRPEDPVTRQESFVLLAKSFELIGNADLSIFSDLDLLANWARGAAEALVSTNSLQGSNGQLNPQSAITRAEFVQLLYNIQNQQPSTILPAASKSEKAKTTVLVYMIGADLESEGLCATDDLVEMTQAKFGDNTKVIVELGGANQWWLTTDQQGNLLKDSSQILTNMILSGIYWDSLTEEEKLQFLNNLKIPTLKEWAAYNQELGRIALNTEAQVQRYQLTPDKLTLLENLGQKSMTDPATLSDFIVYGLTNYPAERYGVILWDHGGGTAVGYGVDEKNGQGKSMTLPDLQRAFDQAYQSTGSKVDFIAFDACLMGTVETALALHNAANYLIASEELEPGGGHYYTNWLNQLSVTPDISTLDLGKVIINDYIRQSALEDEYYGQNTTLAIYDLSKIEPIYQAMQELSDISSDYFMNNHQGATDLLTARSNSFGYAMNGYEQIDILDYLNHLNIPELEASKDKLAQAVQAAVLYSKCGTDMTSNSFGMAMYYPYYALNHYGQIMEMLSELNISDMYSKYYQKVANLVAGMNIASGENPLYSLVGYSGEDLGYDWYNPDFELNYDLDTGDYSNLQFTEKSNGEYVLHLDNWDNIVNVEMQILVDMGESFEPRYIDLGSNSSMKFDIDGDLIVNYDGNWLGFNNLTVPFYLLKTSDEVTYGYVPCIINDNQDYDSQLLVYWDQEHPKGYVAGYRNLIDGAVTRGIFPLDKGDSIQFLVDGYDNNGNFQDSYLYDKPVIYDGSNLQVQWEPIGHYRCWITYKLTDIYQNHYWTEVISFDS